ncbi:MAG: Rab proteins geranylgeranyltransferase component A [Chrysothrix sp. TS-e1954]|nr:MAG: Rab proteins geranylgeranyltransferase component A [Chrysothrix sp. TS-e1954]
METLEDSYWDVVIEGTGLQQSLLALALSRSNKKVLHVDRNNYYGGSDAALSLQDAEEWVTAVHRQDSLVAGEQRTPGQGNHIFGHASITRPQEAQHDSQTDSSPELSFSRAYSLALSPQLISANSRLINSLVQSRVSEQIDFTAMGSWWLLSDEMSMNSNQDALEALTRVPSSREDLLGDSGLDTRTKRGLIKFLRYVSEYVGPGDDISGEDFSSFVSSRFNLSPYVQHSLHAMSMSCSPLSSTKASATLPRIRQHLQSMGLFGPNIAALIPRYGGLAEIAQVSCRAGAVGGGVYMLGNGVKEVKSDADLAVMGGYTDPKRALRLELDQGEHLSTQWFVRDTEVFGQQDGTIEEHCKSIDIISSPLSKLFRRLDDEDSQIPTGAVISVRDLSSTESRIPPVYIIVHSSDTGDCPAGQCVLYSSVALPVSQEGFEVVGRAIGRLLSTLDPSQTPGIESNPPRRLWTLQYVQRTSSLSKSDPAEQQEQPRVITFGQPSLDLVFDDTILDKIEQAWRKVMGDEAAGEFLTFDARGGENVEEEH